MSYSLLSGLKIIEVSAFIAAPLAGLTLAQLGAEVIRIDPIGGGIDAERWPLVGDTSLYWTGLNRAKKSLCVDLKVPEGQAALHRLLQAGGENGGILLTNLTGPDWLSFDTLTKARDDLILVDLKGHHDGAPAVDYTVNASVGVPMVTGPENMQEPVNHMLPAWDAVAGLSLATAVLAALRARGQTGNPQHLSVALSDVAYSFLSNTGVIAEAELSDKDRPRLGNHIYGAFGHHLPTGDGRFVMVVAITARQWQALVDATGLAGRFRALEEQDGLDFSIDTGRYDGRDQIAALLTEWSGARTFEQVLDAFQRHRVLAGPYRTFRQLLLEDPRVSAKNPMFQFVDHSGVGRYRIAGSPIRVNGLDEGALAPGPEMGAHGRDVLLSVGFSDAEIDRLKAANVFGEDT